MVRNRTITRYLLINCIFFALPVFSFAVTGSFNILDYGAKGDGSTLNTKSIQSAIDACASRGGGTVYFPAGKFVSGTLFLKSHITLYLEAGAVLEGSKNLNDYPVTMPDIKSYTDNYTNKSLIYGEGLENIGITGEGTLDGNGASFKPGDVLMNADRFAWYKARPYLIRIINCKDILVRDVTILNSPMWVQHYLACEDVNIDGITVNSRVNNNNDGIDIDGCKRVRISNCDIISGDDAIVLKSSLDMPCKDITITNCVISSDCNAFKLGTETNGGFENINLNNCTIYDTKLGGISLEMVDGGTIDRVSVSNVTMNNVGTAVFIRLGNRARPYLENDPKSYMNREVATKNLQKPGMGKLSNVIISKIQAINVGITGCSITGLPGYPVENITLENIRITCKGGGSKELVDREIPEVPDKYPEFRMFGVLPSFGFYCRHAKNLTFNDVEMDFIEPDERPAIICDDITGLELYKIKAMSVGNGSLIQCRNVKNLFVQSCIAPIGIETFLQITGKSEHITILGNDLSGAKNAIKKDESYTINYDNN